MVDFACHIINYSQENQIFSARYLSGKRKVNEHLLTSKAFLADTPKSAKIEIIETSYFFHLQAYFLRIEKKREK